VRRLVLILKLSSQRLSPLPHSAESLTKSVETVEDVFSWEIRPLHTQIVGSLITWDFQGHLPSWLL